MSYFVWDVSPELFSIGSLSVRWYGLLFATGFIVGYEIMQRIFKIEHRNPKDIDKLTIVMIVSTIVGARLGHCFFYEPEYYLANPIEILYVWKGGLASHGAAITILLGIWYFVSRNKQYTYLWLLDRLAITVAFAASLIRLGNFFNSEILGIPTDVPWAVVFARVDDIPRHAVQLYEAISYLAIFVYLLIVYIKNKEKLPTGRIMGAFLTLVFTARFILEFFKEQQSNLEAGLFLHIGQILSIPLVITGLYFWIKSYYKLKS